MQDTAYFAPVLTIVSTPRTALLLVLLVIAAAVDVRSYRIPNALTLSGMLVGLGCSALAGETVLSGLLNGAAGLFTALLVLIPLHVLRAIGGGDVKLAAACGAFLGWPDILPALFFVVVTGGVMALAWTALRRTTARTGSNVARIAHSLAIAAWTRTAPAPASLVSSGRLPYAVCILVGTAVFLLVRQVS